MAQVRACTLAVALAHTCTRTYTNTLAHLHDNSPQQAAYNIAPPDVGGRHAIADEVGYRACVVSNNLEGGLCGLICSGVAHACQGSCFIQNVQDEVGLIIVGHALRLRGMGNGQYCYCESLFYRSMLLDRAGCAQ